MPGASFVQIPKLTLSTASQLRFDGGVFDVFNTNTRDIGPLTGNPLPGSLGLLPSSLGEERPWIRMEGVSIDVDEALLVDAPGGRIDLDNTRLSVSNPKGDGGTLTLTADLIRVGAGTELLATGSRKGGLVQVGGSWQNSDPKVRQASQTWMQAGSLVDASSSNNGDGGTVVIWSDLANPAGGTVAKGSLLARGGHTVATEVGLRHLVLFCLRSLSGLMCLRRMALVASGCWILTTSPSVRTHYLLTSRRSGTPTISVVFCLNPMQSHRM